MRDNRFYIQDLSAAILNCVRADEKLKAIQAKRDKALIKAAVDGTLPDDWTECRDAYQALGGVRNIILGDHEVGEGFVYWPGEKEGISDLLGEESNLAACKFAIGKLVEKRKNK